MKKSLLTTVMAFVISILFNDLILAQATLETAQPFCTDAPVTYPAGVNTGTAQAGPNYGCLGSQPNPAWYYMKIGVAGAIQITETNSANVDIDFILWGPFPTKSPAAAELTAGKIIDCSYSPQAVEVIDLGGSNVGEYYILLVTNFSNNPTNITLTKTGGTGETDCSILTPAPPTPTLSTPADNAINQPLNINLCWNASATATSYGLQVATDPNFNNLVVNLTGIAGTCQGVGPLLNNIRYYWRVNASNAGGTSDWSAKRSFRALNSAPASYLATTPGTSTFYHWGGNNVVIDAGLTVSGGPYTSALVSINNNFVSAEDRLVYPSVLYGITGTYNVATGVLTLTGAGTAAQYQDVLRSIQYQNINNVNPSTATRTITFQVGSAVYFAGTGHYYQYIPSAGIRWDVAKNLAQTSYLYGLEGYLATITSSNENSFLQQKISNNTWIGGSCDPAFVPGAVWPGTWKWATGPEFGNNLTYTNWAPGEPNNAGGVEAYLHMYANGTWNDFAINNPTIIGYLVEYGGMPGDPTVTLFGNKDIEVYIMTTPAMGSPANGSINQPLNPDLCWNAAPRADSYNLQVATDPAFTNIVGNYTNIAALCQQVGPLNQNTQYYWRVNSFKNGGTSVWSTPWSFITTPITVTAPNGGENWPKGSIQNITWTSTGVTSVNIDITTNNGLSWERIVTNWPAVPGVYPWVLHYFYATNPQCKIRISDYNNPLRYGQSANTFTISTSPQITVLSPNGGENWAGGDVRNITWNSSLITHVKLEYSINNGASWLPIASGVLASPGSYAWTVPNLSSNQVRVRVSDDYDGTPSDISDGPFTIAFNANVITVTAPNGGENWFVGSNQNITWTQSGITTVKVEYSFNNGTTWNLIGTGPAMSLMNTGETDVQKKEDPEIPLASGSYSWTVPNTPSSICLVRVSDNNNPAVFDVSNAVFTISPAPSITVLVPNGGEKWTSGTTQNITWASNGITFVNIDYTTNNGLTWNSIASNLPAVPGLYQWVVPNVLRGKSSKVRVSEFGNPSRYDVSNGTFSITITPYVKVLTPNGGEQWLGGSLQNITWQSGVLTFIKIEYTTNEGASWIPIVSSLPATPSLYVWQVPNIPNMQGRVRISDDYDGIPWDISDGIFTVVGVGMNPIIPVAGNNNLTMSMVGEIQKPEEYTLSQNYPNPFNPTTVIRFGLPRESVVSLIIYNALGERVAELLNGLTLSEGMYSYNFNASTLPSGIYIYKLTAGEFTQIKKMSIIK